MDKELQSATFHIPSMTNILDGGPERTEKRRWILKPLEQLALRGKSEMARVELLEAHFRDFIAIHKPFIENGYTPQREEVAWMSGHATNSGPLMPHMSLSLTTILGQASEDQIGDWLWRALTFQMVISYSQTELAHGSNVRGLQTTAHFDKASGEFVLNTPTLESIKWWNSGLGVAATHALVFAQLIIGDTNHGLHVFMLQVRDENHRVLPGIELGDVGNKLGDNGIDTGYMVLKGVRVAREHLLSKRQHVTPEGVYVKTISSEKSGASRLHYLTMMTARAGMISIAGSKLAIAALVATRYACMREQGFKQGSTHSEHQIIDYQMQLYRLLKQTSTAYLIKFGGQWISQKISSIDITAADIPEEVLDEIAQIHTTSAGLKGLSTILAADGIEDCRKCCGGHGFLLSSGIAALSADYVWQTTAEGDHIVLFIQAAKALVKQALPLREAVRSEFHALQAHIAKDRFFAVSDWFNLDFLEELFYAQRLNSLNYVLDHDAGDRDSSDILLCQLTRAHCLWFLLSKFKEIVISPSVAASGDCQAVLQRLCAFWACAQVFDAASIQWSGLLTHDQILVLSRAVHQLLHQLRPDALALVESFDIPDHVHQSTIGSSDGKPYQALYQSAKASRLNQLPIDSWYQHLRPNLDLDYLKARSRL